MASCSDGATVHVFTMTNNHGMRAQVLDLGGIICDVEAPGRDGKMANVILCQKDLAGDRGDGPDERADRPLCQPHRPWLHP